MASNYDEVPVDECDGFDGVDLTATLQPPVPRSRWTRTKVMTIGVVFSTVAVLTAIIPWSHRPLLTASSREVISFSAERVYNEPSCIRNTGGTCAVYGCYADRGPVDCTMWNPGGLHVSSLGKYCMCVPGKCSTINGVCHTTPNRLVGQRVLIRNVQWPEWYLFSYPLTSHVGFGNSSKAFDEDRWNVYEVDGVLGECIITNERYPDYALTITKRTTSHTVLNLFTKRSSRDDVDYSFETKWIREMDATYITVLKKAPWRTPAFFIENLRYPNLSIYVGEKVLFANTSHEARFPYTFGVDFKNSVAPGPHKYWFFDPPLQSSSTALSSIAEFLNSPAR